MAATRRPLAARQTCLGWATPLELARGKPDPCPRPIDWMPAPRPCTGDISTPGSTPLLTVDSGDTVTISTVSGPREVMPPPPLVVPAALAAVQAHVPQKLPGHMCTGPVAIKGAKAGQVLEVRIKAIDLHYDWGYNYSGPLDGRAAGRLPEPAPHAHPARSPSA